MPLHISDFCFRSEVNDTEFEALESIVNLGDASSAGGYKKTIHSKDRTKSVDLFSSPSKFLESSHRSVPRSLSVDHGRTPMDISPVPDNSKQHHGGTSNSDIYGSTNWAKFCHECGHHYPTNLAKFCSECGEKRVCKL